MALFVTATLVSMAKQQDFQNETKDTFLDSVVLYLFSPCTQNTHARTHTQAHVHLLGCAHICHTQS